jgi:hypothetical protein
MSKKSCLTCRHALTSHNACFEKDGVKSYCLENDGYHNYEFGDPGAVLREQQLTGKSNILIGHSGEAECNANWSKLETYERLCRISEQCGYLTTIKGDTVSICTEYLFHLQFKNDRLVTVTEDKTKIIVWERGEA